jgi:hypothetical protein
MAVKAFPWLADIEPIVRSKIDLPVNEPGTRNFDFNAEFVAACNDQQLYIWERLSSTDRNFGLVFDDTVTATKDAEYTDLPAAVRALRKVQKLNTAGQVCGVVDFATIDEQDDSHSGEGSGMYLPDSNQIRWLKPWDKDQPLRLVYNEQPPHLAHGCCSAVGGLTTAQLGAHESIEDDILNGLQLLIYSGPGAGEKPTIASAAGSYVGRTKVATFTVAMTTATTMKSKYTCRPKLRYDTKDAFIYGVASRMLEKMRNEKWFEMSERREAHLRHLTTAAMLTSRESPLYTRDDSETGGHGDPFWT